MKAVLISFACILSLNLLLAEPIDSLKIRVSTLEAITKRELYSKDSLIRVLQIEKERAYKAKDSIISINNRTEKEAEYNEKLLGKFDFLTNYLFAIIGIAIGAGGLIGYFFLFRPAREDVKEARNDVKEARKIIDDLSLNRDKLFLSYFNEHRASQVDIVIETIEKNPEAIDKIAHLESFKYEGFNLNQVGKIVVLIDKNTKYRQQLISMISYTNNLGSETFFIRSINDENFDWPEIALSFFAKYNITSQLNAVINYIIRVNEAQDNLMAVGLNNAYHAIRPYSIAFLQELFNQDRLVDSLNNIEVNTFIERNFIQTAIPGNIELHSTKLYQKYLNPPNEEEEAQPNE